jgi:electron transfer flavoprotein alpha subunit
MRILVIAEHDNSSVKPATLNTIAAARLIGGEIDLLIAGHGMQSVIDAASNIQGIGRVLVAEAPCLADNLAENLQATVMQVAKNYSHIFAPATAFGKNVAPRIAAALDVAQISDVIAHLQAADLCRRVDRDGTVRRCP